MDSVLGGQANRSRDRLFAHGGLHMRNAFLFNLIVLMVSVSSFALGKIPDPKILKDGDLVFQKSNSAQAQAIEDAQGGPWSHMGLVFQKNEKWYVAEAVQPVKVTSFDKWVRRGRNQDVVIKRIPRSVIDLSQAGAKTKLYGQIEKEMGKSYDIFFQWSDDRIYCSELVYKAFQRAFQWAPGQLQRIKDLNLNSEAVQRLIEEREAALGKPIDYNEPIITPYSMMMDPNLELVFSSQAR